MPLPPIPFKLSYVLPEPGSYRDWLSFDADLAAMRGACYDAVELQIADPLLLDEEKLRRSLDAAGFPLCAIQTGSTYSTRGNCLSARDPEVRARTAALLRGFIDLASRWKSVVVFGLLQGRSSDEPDAEAGRVRIVEAMTELWRYAADQGVVVAFEPVNQLEVGWHHTIAEVERLVRSVSLPSARMMIDAFHMNIEEPDMIVPLPRVADILAHVHLVETNRDLLGYGHLDTRALCEALGAIEYAGFCSVGVFNTAVPRRECIARSMYAIREAMA